MTDALLSASSDQVITWLTALVAVAVVLVVWGWLLAPRTPKSRIRALIEMRDELYRAQNQTEFHVARARAFSFVERAVERLNLMKDKRAGQFRERLVQAGWRGKNALVIYVFLRFVMLLASMIGAILFLYIFPVFDISNIAKLAATLGAVLTGMYVPSLVVSKAIEQRQDKITKAMPDGLDLLLVCAEAGLSFEAALDYVANETNQTLPEFSDEISQTLIELKFVPDRRLALQNLARRVQIPDMRSFVNTLMQTERHGTPLSQALRVMSEDMRTKRMTKAEEKAARLPAVLTIPMLVFILPTLFVVIIGPAVLDMIDVFREMK